MSSSAKESAKDILKKVKALFVDAPAAPTTPSPAVPPAAKVIAYPVDGQAPVYVDISDDGMAGIDAADAVFSDAAMTTPYADGTYNVTGTTFGFTVAAGLVTTVTDPAGTGAGTPMDADTDPVTVDLSKPAVQVTPPTAATPAQMKEVMNKFAAGTPEERIANLEIIARALIESEFGWQMREQQVKADAAAAINIYNTSLKAATDKVDASEKVIEKHEKTIAGLFELVEKLVELPTEDPKTLTGVKKEQFDRTEKKEKKMQDIADAMKQMKGEAKK